MSRTCFLQFLTLPLPPPHLLVNNLTAQKPVFLRVSIFPFPWERRPSKTGSVHHYAVQWTPGHPSCPSMEAAQRSYWRCTTTSWTGPTKSYAVQATHGQDDMMRYDMYVMMGWYLLVLWWSGCPSQLLLSGSQLLCSLRKFQSRLNPDQIRPQSQLPALLLEPAAINISGSRRPCGHWRKLMGMPAGSCWGGSYQGIVSKKATEILRDSLCCF